MANKYEYLDLLDRKLDDNQKAACCVQKNTIVAAGAGSGKTQVLATRFAWLVMSCNVPAGKILTLTFTRKAAAEMYSRIYSILNFFANNPNTPEKEKHNAQKAIKEFAEVHIQTLDSYCHSIVKQSANRYGINPNFSVSEDDINIDLEALEYVFANKDHPAVQDFASLGDYQAFANTYLSFPVTKYTSIANYKGFFIDGINSQNKLLCEFWNDEVKKIESGSQNILRLIKVLSSDNEIINEIYNIFSSISGFFYFSEGDEKRFEDDFLVKQVEGCLSDMFRLVSARKTRLKKTEAIQIAEIQNSIKKNVESLEIYYQQIKNFTKLRSLLELIEDFSCKINEKKRISGNLSMVDVSKMALKILAEQKDIRTQEKNAFEKIMIDEFQDNNGENRDLLFLLSEKNDIYTEIPKKIKAETIKDLLKSNLDENKLYFVGDEKQSIYRFRNADVSVFKELEEDLKTIPIPMKNNYRSKIELLTSFNQIFGGFDVEGQYSYSSIFDHDKTHSYEAIFTEAARAEKVDLLNHKKIEPKALTQDSVRTHVCMYDSDNALQTQGDLLSTEDQIAYFIAKTIKEKYETGEYSYSSFAILDKTRSKRHYFTKWLNRFGIPYAVETTNRLFDEAPINDIYNFLKLCVYPSDARAYAALLSSPFVNLETNTTIEILAYNTCTKEENTEKSSFNPFDLPDSLERILSETPEELKKFNRAKKIYTENRSNFLGQSIAKTVTFLWQNLGYYYETLQNRNTKLLSEQFDLLFELAKDCDLRGGSLSWFIDELDILRANEESFFSNEESGIDLKNINYPLERDDAVQIMTIHKSKGLEFPVVFAIGCTGKAKSFSANSIYYSEKCGFTVSPPGGYKNAFSYAFNDFENEQEFAEYKRLIYVAFTRASDELFIMGSWGSKKYDETKIFQSLVLNYYSAIEEINKNLGKVFFYDYAPFDFCSIEPQTKSVFEIINENNSKRKNKKIDLNVIKKIYSNADIVYLPKLESNRKTPSGLEVLGVESDFSTPQIKELDGLDELILKNLPQHEKEKSVLSDNSIELESSDVEVLMSENFTYADFGTLAHAFLYDFVNEQMKDDFSKSDFTGGIKLFKNLNEHDENLITDYCIKMCFSFAKSSLGKKLYDAIQHKRFVKAEWAFRMYKDDTFYTGSIDLIFQDEDGSYVLVDYKTDLKANKEKYIGQQYCYRSAAANMLNVDEKKISCHLFYLRYSKQQDL